MRRDTERTGAGAARSAASGEPRHLYADNLRNLAVLALILFHTARLFDSDPWHIKDAGVYDAADALVTFFNPWHMPLLFLLAGVSAVWSMRRRGIGTFLGERVNRLLVPLVAGIVLTVLPQVYLERISPYVPNRNSPIDFDGGFLAFVPRFFSFQPYPAGDFSWHHLWFVAYLFVYSILLAPVLFWMARAPAAGRIGERLSPGIAPFLLFLPLVAIELLLRGAWPSTHGLIDDWADHAAFIFVILAGGVIAASPVLAEAIHRRRGAALLLAVASMAIWLPREDIAGLLGITAAPVFWTLRVATEWFWILALLGYSREYLDRPVPYLTAFTRYAFPFYIFHQFVIVWLGWLTFGWQSMPLAKYLAIASVSLVVSYGLARLFDLTAPTRYLIGLKARRPPPPAPAIAAD